MKLNSGVLASLCLAGLVSAKAVHRAEKIDSRLSRRQYDGNNTANQLIDGTPCRDITVIFARGTFEGGNVGAVVGPSFFQQLVNVTSVDQVAVQGVRWS